MKPLSILIFSGLNGWLGNRFFRRACVEWADVNFAYKAKFSLFDTRFSEKGEFQHWIDTRKPDVVVNCIAKTNVDKCEFSHPKNSKDDQWLSNALIPKWIAECCVESKVKLFIHISSDFVFDKGKDCRTLIDERDQDYNPVNGYGITKLAGDLEIARIYNEAKNPNLKARIVRTSGIFGYGKATFVDYVLSNLNKGLPIRCSNESYSIPTNIDYIVEYLVNMIKQDVEKKDDVDDELRFFKNCVSAIIDHDVSKFRYAQDIMNIGVAMAQCPDRPDLIQIADPSEFKARRPYWSCLKASDEYLAPDLYGNSLAKHIGKIG